MEKPEADKVIAELINIMAQIQKDKDNLIAPEEDVAQAAKNNLFRAFHTIKGVAGLHGLSDLIQLSGVLERLFDGLRLGKILMSFEIKELVNEGQTKMQDSLKAESASCLGKISKLEDLCLRIGNECAKEIIQELTAEEKKELLKNAKIDPAITASFTAYEENRLFAILRSKKGLYKIKVPCNSNDIINDKLPKVMQAIRDIKLGEIIATFPDSVNFNAEEMTFWIYLGSEMPVDLITKALNDFEIKIDYDTSFMDEEFPWGIE